MFRSKYVVYGGIAVVVLAGIANLRQCVAPDKPEATARYNTARPAQPATTAKAATASSTDHKPVPEPVVPDGVKPGYIERSVRARDQYKQWVTLHSAVVPQATLDFTIPQPEEGAVTDRRTVVAGWIHSTQPTQTVTLHVVGATAHVWLSISGTWVEANHSSAWRTDPTQTRAVVSLPAGWHRIELTADRKAGQWAAQGDTDVRVQLGAVDTDPVVPVPYAVPAAGKSEPAEPSSTPAPASSVAPAPATTAPAPASSITAPSAPTGEPVEQGGSYAS